MASTNYDEVSADFDQRYARAPYAAVAQVLRAFMQEPRRRVLDVGCGTGHWLGVLAADGHELFGIDPSAGMLARAKTKDFDQRVVRGRAEALAFADARFDRVIMVNALHHFADPRRALREARRVLCPGGALISIGLDPASLLDRWSLYEFFAGTFERDCERYPPAAAVREWMSEAGFAQCTTMLAELIEQHVPAREVLASGALAKNATSQLSELSDAAYAEGLAAVESAARADASRGDTLLLHARLHLFATTGRLIGS